MTEISTERIPPRCRNFKVNFTPVELPYISCKNLAEVVHIRHYLQESCKYLTFQTNLSDSGRSDISSRCRRFLLDSCRSRHFWQDSWTDAVNIFQFETFILFIRFTFKIHAFSSKLLLKFRQFLPSYF